MEFETITKKVYEYKNSILNKPKCNINNCVKNRLDDSLNVYEENLLELCEYLINNNCILKKYNNKLNYLKLFK